MIVSGSSDRRIVIRQLGSTNHQTLNNGSEMIYQSQLVVIVNFSLRV